MLDKNTIAFLKRLKKNANKTWVDAHRDGFNEAKEDLLLLTHEVLVGLRQFDKPIAKSNLIAKKCMTRLNRDMRFATGKDTYKDEIYGAFNHEGKNALTAGYFFHVQPGQCFAGGGSFNPLPLELRFYREGISKNFDEFKSIINSRTFKKNFPNGLQTSGSAIKLPHGFDREDPAAEYLKMKGYMTREPMTDAQMTSKDGKKRILQLMKQSKPLVDFLNAQLKDVRR